MKTSRISIVFLMLILLISGCSKVTYRVGAQTFNNRADADARHIEIMNSALANCTTADTTTAYSCVMVSPTLVWLTQNYVKTKGRVNDEVIDYLLGTLQRSIDTQYKMIEKSGIFKQCRFAKAEAGNGEHEGLATSGEFIIIAAVRETDGARIYNIFGPANAKMKVIGAADIDKYCNTGWKSFIDIVEELAL